MKFVLQPAVVTDPGVDAPRGLERHGRPPSIRRRRSSVSATCAWLGAHPLRLNVGTLPGGVAEVDRPAALAAALAAGAVLTGAAAPVIDPAIDVSHTP